MISFAQFRRTKGELCFMQRPKFPTEDRRIVTNKQGRDLNAKNTDFAREKPRQPQDLEVPRKTNLGATLNGVLPRLLLIHHLPAMLR